MLRSIPSRMAMTTALLATAWTPAVAQSTHRPSAAAVRMLRAAGRAFRSAPVWTATYQQDYIAAGMTAGERASGTVWIGWPDRALFRSRGAGLRIMGLEGRHVRLLDFESHTCDDHVLTTEEWQRLPLATILDPGSATSRFAVTLGGDHRLVLYPLHPGGIARVEMTLAQDHLPSSVVIVDPQGAINRFWFHGWKKRPAPPPNGWLPSPPPGLVCTALSPSH